MRRNRCLKRSAVGLLGLALAAGPSLALDSSRINAIRRAGSGEKLAELAEKYLKEDATRTPKDFEEGTQIASEATAYLLYIQVRQNELILERLDALVDKE